MFNLMLVDDEQHDRRAVKIMLEKNPRYEIIAEAANGQQAIELACRLKPDLILMDIKMPKVDGLEAAGKIKRALENTEIIMLTAYDEFDYAKAALEQEAAGYLLKPFTASDLLSALDKAASKIQQKQSLLEELEKFKQELEANLDSARAGFCSQVLFGQNLSEEELRAHASLLKLKTIPNTVVMVQPQLIAENYLVQELTKKHVFAALTGALCAKYPDQVLVNDVASFNRLLAILPAARGGYNQLASWLENLLGEIAAKHSVTLKAGMGGSFERLSQLYNSYEQAQIALSTPDSSNNVLCYQDIEEAAGSSSYSLYLEQQLVLALQAGNAEDFLKWLEEILRHVASRSKADIDVGRAIASELLFKVYRAVTPGETKSFGEQIKKTEQLLEVQNWAQLAAFLRNEAIELARQVTTKNNRRHKLLAAKAKAFVAENYQQEISLDKIADLLGISSGYFSSIFKEVEGINFSEFLLCYRVAAAKKLLLDPAVNIAEAGYKAGFNDPAYFSRIFKRIAGVSPTSFRMLGKAGGLE